MREGWCGDDHLIIFAESEVGPVSERYAIPALLPGYRILGLRGWDDFIVQDAANRSYSIPNVPLDLQYLSPLNIPPNVRLLKDERFEGKIKWYIKPVVFGGDPRAEDNITWVSHEQNAQLVRWWKIALTFAMSGVLLPRRFPTNDVRRSIRRVQYVVTLTVVYQHGDMSRLNSCCVRSPKVGDDTIRIN